MRARSWRIRWLVVTIVGMAPTTGFSVASADTPPSIWDIARDPAERARWELHERVPAFRCNSQEAEDEDKRRETELRCLDLLEKLEEADAAHSPDARLRVDLGAVEYELADITGRAELYTKAAAILSAAVDAAPDAPSTTEALGRLVYAYAKLGRSREELAAWRRYIPKLVDPHSRVVDMMNMGEAEMRMGEIDDALATFHEVLRQCADLPNTSFTYVLTLWDVAVALDRSGDPRGALKTASEAAHEAVLAPDGQMWSGRDLIKRSRDVFFVPEWEREWYIALGAASLGQEATDAATAWKAWSEAERAWDAYVTRSESSGERDRWLAIARLRRDHARAERVVAEKKVPKRAAKTLPRPGIEE
jgi:tetratricopeptide (TPR) repeat protein